MANYSWPPLKDRKVMGQRLTRHDGVEKASGKAKYTSDYKKPNMLHGAVAVSPHANARVRSIDTSVAEKMPGVKAIYPGVKAGEVVQWAGWEVAFVAAETEAQARDAARAITVDYEALPHVVNEADPKKAGDRIKPAGEQIEGDPDAAFKAADVVSEGVYHIPTLQHCCLESHGSVVQWTGDKVEFNPSTQAVTAIRGDLRGSCRCRSPMSMSTRTTSEAASDRSSRPTVGASRRRTCQNSVAAVRCGCILKGPSKW